MSDVTGPIASLPGSFHDAEGMCDDHPDRPAVKRVQGETDSFGSEMHDMCAECAEKHKAERFAPWPGQCDWCKQDVADRKSERDYEEGMSGPVYLVCVPCINRRDERVLREMNANGDFWHDGDDADDEAYGR